MPHLLIVSHIPSINTRAMTDAVVSGASHEDILREWLCGYIIPFDAGGGRRVMGGWYYSWNHRKFRLYERRYEGFFRANLLSLSGKN